MTAQNPQKIEEKNIYFHIYNKGVENRKLFNDDQDYQVFIGYLEDYLTTPPDPEKLKKTFSVKGRAFKGVPHQPKNYFNKIELIAYSLLPDHFHLLVNETTKGFLEKLIRSLSTRYAIYYNKKYHRTGSLFQGPYKSAQIKDISQLLYLTRYLHREPSTFSSYEEYLGVRVTSWIKPNVILSHLNNSKNDYFKGIGGYKNFVEKHELKQKEKKILEGITIERKPVHRKRKDIKPERSESFKEVHAKPATETRLKMPVFVASSTLAFVLLFTVGFKNVTTSSIENTKSIASIPSPTSQVAGVDEEISEVEDLITEETKEVEDIEEMKSEPKTVIVIKITDESESVNIREKPTTKSVIVGKAEDGDTFEFISQDSEWYQIKLDDGKVAFVSVRYAEIEEGENK